MQKSTLGKVLAIVMVSVLTVGIMAANADSAIGHDHEHEYSMEQVVMYYETEYHSQYTEYEMEANRLASIERRLYERFGESDVDLVVEIYGIDVVNAFFEEWQFETNWNAEALMLVAFDEKAARALPCPTGCGGIMWTERTVGPWGWSSQRVCVHGRVGVADIYETRTVTLRDRGPCGWASTNATVTIESRWRCP